MVDEHDRIAVINEQACSLLELAPQLDELIGRSTARAGRRACARLLADARRGDRAAARDRARRRAGALPLPRVPRRAPDRLRLRAARGRAGCGCSATSRGSSCMEEEQREFLATMSHEIKTPLSGIAGAAELLRDGALPAARARAGRGDRRRRAVARPGCCATCSTSSRAEAGREERGGRGLRPAAAADLDRRRAAAEPARPAARAARRRRRRRAGRAARRRGARAPDRAQPGVATRSSTRSAARRGSSAGVAGAALLITVSDTGPRDRRRGPARGCSSRGRAATAGRGRAPGSGSSIARRLARAMGGDVTVVSELGEGSAFTLELPLAEGEVASSRARRRGTARWPRAGCWWPRTTPRCGG